ncbi:MAG: peptidase MA family metallohydrolase [Armatimonadota bacterium]
MIRLRALNAALVVLLIISFALSQANAATGEAKSANVLTHTLTSDFFVVHFDPSDPYLPRLMSETARIALIRVSHDLGYKLEKNRPFTLNVYRTHLSFIEAGGLEDSKFTVGTANSRNEVISVDASGVFSPADQTLAHEITHAVIFRILGAKVTDLPLWVNEGIAQYESEEFPDADNATVATAAADIGLIPLADLSKIFPKNKMDLAYAESASAIRYMVNKHGKSSPRLMLKELALTGSFDRAMLKATGQTGERFAENWESAVARHYFALKFTRMAMGIIPVIMAILAIIAYFVRRKQKIEAARQWDREQFEETLRRQLGNDWRR